jgi:hypothetical protein
MARRSSKANHGETPDPNRLQTRSKNASTHPGHILLDRPVEVEDEKRVRNERRQARQQKKVDLQAAVLDIAAFENQMAVDDAEVVVRFPQHKPKGELVTLLSNSYKNNKPSPDDSKAEAEAIGNKKRKGKGTTSLSLHHSSSTNPPAVGHSKITERRSTTHSIKSTKPDQTKGEETKGEETEGEDTEIDQRQVKRLKTASGKSKQTETVHNRALRRTGKY